MTYKIGDKFEVIKGDCDFKKGEIIYLIQPSGIGFALNWFSKRKDANYDDKDVYSFEFENLRVGGGSLFDSLQVGDVLVDENKNEVKILAKSGLLVAISGDNDFTEFNQWCAESLLKEYGLILKGSPKQMTLSQISKELGYPVEVVEE